MHSGSSGLLAGPKSVEGFIWGLHQSAIWVHNATALCMGCHYAATAVCRVLCAELPSVCVQRLWQLPSLACGMQWV